MNRCASFSNHLVSVTVECYAGLHFITFVPKTTNVTVVGVHAPHLKLCVPDLPLNLEGPKELLAFHEHPTANITLAITVVRNGTYALVQNSLQCLDKTTLMVEQFKPSLTTLYSPQLLESSKIFAGGKQVFNTSSFSLYAYQQGYAIVPAKTTMQDLVEWFHPSHVSPILGDYQQQLIEYGMLLQWYDDAKTCDLHDQLPRLRNKIIAIAQQIHIEVPRYVISDL